MRAIAFVVVLLGVLLGACARPASVATPIAPQAPTRGFAAADLTRKTVALVRIDEDDGSAHAFCSGVWISPSRILTAAHCVRTNPFAQLFGASESIRYVTRGDVFPDGVHELKYAHTREAARVRVDEDLDLALLYTSDAPEHPSAFVATSEINQGAVAQSMGHPKGLWWSYSAGEVAAVRERQGAGEGPAIWWIQTTAPISPGNSGGGLFDGEGALIGIASWKPLGRGVEGIAFFVHRDHIASFLKASP